MCLCCALVQVRGLKRTDLILPELYPSFTLLRQALGAVKLGREALTLLVPEVGVQWGGVGFLLLGTCELGSSGGSRVSSWVCRMPQCDDTPAKAAATCARPSAASAQAAQ